MLLYYYSDYGYCFDAFELADEDVFHSSSQKPYSSNPNYISYVLGITRFD